MKISLSLLVYLAVRCLGKCYYPNGVEAADFPCDPDAENSVCCSDGSYDGYACLSNKLCQAPDGRIIRGTCTDQTWGSPDCPNFCLKWDAGGRDLISCSNVTQKDTSYCCKGMEGCCNSGVGRFEVLPAQPSIWALWESTKTRYVVKSPLSTAPSSAGSSTILTSSTASTATSTTSNAPEQTSASNVSTSPSDGTRSPTETGLPGQGGASQPSTATGSGQSSGLSTAAQAGIGVGAAIGALLVAAVAYLWWKLHKTQKLIQPNESEWPGPHDAYSALPPATSYYPQDLQQKFELQGDRGAYELHGNLARTTELSAVPSYAPESPVTARANA